MVKRKGNGVFAAVGAAMGLGNAFRFPALCAKYGLSFIVAYALCLALVGYPLLCAELNYGRSRNRGRWAGFANLLMRMAAANSAVIALYYGVIACKLSGAIINFALFSNVDTYGYMPLLTALFIFPTVFFILKKGSVALNVSGKISVFAGLALFSSLAVKGIAFGITDVNFSSLLCGEAWVEAVGQTLLSLSLAAGVMPTFARTMPVSSVNSTALKIVVANLIGCIFSALSVCPFCLSVNVEGGIACAFTVYPQVIFYAATSPVGRRVLGVCVYGVLTAVSIHSLCSLAAPLLSNFNKKSLSALIFCILSALLAPVLCLNECQALSCCDRVACCVTAVTLAFLECLLFAKGGGGNALMKVLIKFVCPIVCGIAAILSVCSARFSSFNALSLTLGALTALFPICYALLPRIARLKFYFSKRLSSLDKLK
ncbi:MAG: hypothetical protein ACI4MN_01110 [Candidatus Coproplasma sp.]